MKFDFLSLHKIFKLKYLKAFLLWAFCSRFAALYHEKIFILNSLLKNGKRLNYLVFQQTG